MLHHEFIWHKDTGEAVECGLFWTQHVIMVYHQFFSISNAQAEKQDLQKNPEEGV